MLLELGSTGSTLNQLRKLLECKNPKKCRYTTLVISLSGSEVPQFYFRFDTLQVKSRFAAR